MPLLPVRRCAAAEAYSNLGATMKLVFQTDSTNSEYNADCDCAVVEVTPALVKLTRRRAELAKQARRRDRDLWELYFWGRIAEFFDYDLIGACEAAFGDPKEAKDWSDGFERDGHAVLPPTADLAALEPHRTECDQMILRCVPGSRRTDIEIAWLAIPKHSDIYVTTRDVPLVTLETLAAQQAPPKTRRPK
jgi:hypothetical protein